MRHPFRHLGGALNTFRCTRCGSVLNQTTEKQRCRWRDGVIEAFRVIRRTLGLTRRQAYDEIYGTYR